MRKGKLMTKRVAAIVLSSMMVLSPLTAFAAEDDPNKVTDNGSEQGSSEDAQKDALERMAKGIQATQGAQYGPMSIQSDEWTRFLFEGNESGDNFAFETKKDYLGKEYKNVTKASFKKTIVLKDYKNTDYIPSVPEIRYTYSITPNGDLLNQKIDTYQMDLGTVVYKGIDGGITTTAPVVEFYAGDTADGDKEKDGTAYKGRNDGNPASMTKLVEFGIDPSVFQKVEVNPGVYRYLLVEEKEENLDTNIKTDGTDAKDILDDVEKIKDEFRGRVIDIVIQKVNPQPGDPARQVVGVILHEARIKWEQGENGEYRWKVIGLNGKTKVEGYTPYSFKDDEDTPGDPKEAYSRYYTFDLVVDKEITGTGLQKDEDKKTFTFQIDLEGPVGAKIEVSKVNGTNLNTAGANEVWELNAEGKLSKTVTVSDNHWFELSGLPKGAKYTVKEIDVPNGFKVHTAHNVTKDLVEITNPDGTKDNVKAITMDTADKKVDAINGDAAIVKAGEAEKNGVEAVAVERLTWAEELITGRDDLDIQNVLIINDRPPVTVTGVVMNVAPYALMVIAAAIFAGLFISKKRQEEEI